MLKTKNKLLSAIAKKDLERLSKRMTRVSLPAKTLLQRPNELVKNIYFPESGVLSILSRDDRMKIEIATVGNEGFVGLPAYLGTGSSPNITIAQVPGESLRMDARAFREEVSKNPRLRRVLDRYLQALFSLLAQAIACNRLHSIQQRCARWLLMAHDRVEEDTFSLTHQFLAQMLGVRRAGVSEAAGDLQKSGLIKYGRGRISIIDREGLEETSCECYGVIRRELDRLVG